MEKLTIIPRTNDKRGPFYKNIGEHLAEALTEMGIDPKTGDEVVKECLAWPESYAKQLKAEADAKAAAQDHAKQNKLSHDELQALLDQLKVNPAYTPKIQALLGTAPTEHDPAAKAGADQPVVKQSFVAGHVDLRCLKHHHSQIKILCQRGAETTATVLAVVTTPRFVDPRPNLLPGQPETRIYTMIYVDHDVEVGRYSAPVSVAVLPQP